MNMQVQTSQGYRVANFKERILEPKYIRPGDMLVLNGDIYYVETIQRNCPSLESLKHVFTAWLLVDRSGNKLARRDIFGPQKVWRRS